jgi:hypothetical protein
VTIQNGAPTVAQTEFFYRYSANNTTWTAWTSAGLGTGSANALNFTFAQGDGYYEFYSRATDGSGTTEAASPFAQASVHCGPPEYTTAAIVRLDNLAQVYDGTPRSAGVTTVPPGLTHTVTYNGSPSAPISPGSYAVAVTVTQSGFTGTVSGTLTVSAAAPVAVPAMPAWALLGLAALLLAAVNRRRVRATRSQ